MENLKGTIKRSYYSSPSFSAGVLLLKDGREVKFNGKCLLSEGDDIVATGDYITDKKYGKSFKIESFTHNTEMDRSGLIEYIAQNKKIVGIGPVKAKKLVDSLENVEDIFNIDPDVLSKKVGAPPESVKLLQEDLKSKRLHTKLLTELQPFGISFAGIHKIIDVYGTSALTVIKENPYILIGTVPGFSFKRVDAITLKMGIKKEDPNRIRTCLLFLMGEALNKGNSYLLASSLLKEANTYLHIDKLNAEEIITSNLNTLITENKLLKFHNLITFPYVYNMENWLASYFKTISRNPCTSDVKVAELFLEAPFSNLNNGQREAVRNFILYNKLIISGGAGVGKSYLSNSILALCNRLGLKTVLCSPTGKAAKRLSFYTGQEAHTIHKLLGYKGGNNYTYDNPLLRNVQVILIDEVSMCGTTLIYNLLTHLPESCIVVFVGDHNQLPSVEFGNVLQDAISHYPIPKTILSECMRQAGELKENCNLLLNGKVAQTSKSTIGTTQKKPWYKIHAFDTTEAIREYIEKAYSSIIVDKFGYNLLEDVQLLTPTHIGPLGTVELNKLIQKVVQEKLYGIYVPDDLKKKYLVGDKVINKKNNYDLGVFNGDTGIVKDIPDAKSVLVNIAGRDVLFKDEEIFDLYLAYALTVHSYQGDQVKMALFICHKSHHFMHSRNLIYTACTRAQQSCAIIGDLWGITNCAKVTKSYERNSLLPLITS